jgi:hypothetical protein
MAPDEESKRGKGVVVMAVVTNRKSERRSCEG